MAFTDNFTGTNGDDLEGRTGWTLAAGSAGAAEINASNQLKASGTGSTGHAYTAPDAGTADHYGQCVYRGGLSGPLAPAVRVTNANNYFAIRPEAAAYTLFRRTTAVGLVSIGSYATTPASGDVLKLNISGTSLEFFLNTVSRITVTDSAHSGVQTPGIICRTSTADPWIDDWESTQGGGLVISYFSAVAGARGVNSDATGRAAGLVARTGSTSSATAAKSISLGLSAISGAIGSSSGKKSATAGISAIAGLLAALETTTPGTSDFNAITGALISITHSTARLSTIQARAGAIGNIAGIHQATRSLQAIAGAVASIEGPPDDNRVSSFSAIAGAAAALSKATARIASVAAKLGAIGSETATTIRAAQVAAIAGLRAAIAGINAEAAGRLLTISVSARAAFECAISARATYHCTVSEAIVQ